MAVDLALAKQHLRVTSDSEDALIGAYLNAAKAWVENYTSTKLARVEVTQTVCAFAVYVPLLYGPNPEGVEVSYTDADDQAATFADGRLLDGRLYAPVTGWPSFAEHTPITLTYTAGFETAPGDLDAAVLLLVGEYYQNREAGNAAPAVTMAVEALCRPYRSVWV